MQYVIYILVGLIGGIFSGLFGIGGGAVMIPALVYFLGMTQHQAQGTCLAVLLPPIGILAVLRYYQSGHVNFIIALFIALGFVFGAYFGADAIQGVPGTELKKAFGIFLVLLGLKMVFFK
ncbi:MAG: sulfite exporter TauE/SafE family protein [Candidatus Omnitrophica bacterium]|nr:sulfite exporter TauE/SafE family protein [Candidatus Omnitrophota bacterium]